MNELVINRTPDVIAAEINSIKDQTKNIVLFNSIEIGRRLVEAKELISHGEWGNWLEEKVEYSQRTAQNLMKIFNEYGSNQLSLLGNNAKSQALADLTYTQAVALLGIPEDEREEFVKENKVQEMSTRELQQAIKERDQAKEDLEDVRELLKTKSEENLKYYNENYENKKTVKELQDALQKEKEASKKETERLQLLIDNMKNKISTAEASGNNDEVDRLQETLEKYEAELNESKEKIKDLEEQLQTPADAVIVEKVPENIEKELEELRAKAQNQGADVKVKFKIHFDILVKSFNDLLNDLEGMAENEELHDKYRNAVHGLIDKMVERL